MAFNPDNSGSTGNNTASRKDKKADRFLNLYITGNDGKPVKVSFIGLHMDVPHEKAIIDYLDANPAGIDNVLGAFTAVYRTATPKPFVGFSFGA